MPDVFQDKEQSEEARYKLDEEQRFKVRARRNKLLGLWAADQMGLSAGDAEAYGKSIVTLEFEAPGDDNITAKILSDFTANQVSLGAGEIKRKMADLASTALQQITGDFPEALGKDHRQVGG